MRLGVIASSGGSALAAAMECMRKVSRAPDLHVITDRACGTLDWARREAIDSALIPYASAEAFSQAAFTHFQRCLVDCVLLLYTRRVTEPLIGGIPVYNIHPGLLPAFRGLHAVRDAVQCGARVLGATLHAVDHALDTGPIVAQVACGRPLGGPLTTCEKISFLQKVYLILLLCELAQDFAMTMDRRTFAVTFARTPGHSLTASPALSDPQLAAAFSGLQVTEQCRVVY